MDRLGGLDASFFYLETPTTHMHVMGLSILDPSTAPGGYSFEGICRRFASRLHHIPTFRKRVRMVPLSLDHPIWEDDPEFDITSHIHHVALPSPGSSRELAEFVGDIAGHPLDRSIPLWEAWVIEGLEGGRVAILTKVHHAVMDGVSGAAVLAHLLDTDADVPIDDPEPWRAKRSVWDVELFARALWRSSSRIGVSQIPQIIGNVGRLTMSTLRSITSPPSDEEPAVLPFDTPVLPFNKAISPRRAVAFGCAALDDVKQIRHAAGATVNDVVLTACSLSLRDYLDRRNALPDIPLVAAVPVAVRTEAQRDVIDNRVSTMFVRLPVQLADPFDQLRAVSADASRAKKLHATMGANMLHELMQFTPPRLLSGAMQLYSSLHLANRHRPAVNLVVSNVPGAPMPLYFAGSRVESIYPMGPVIDGAGLNLTVLSNMGRIDIGAIACRETVPGLEEIAEGFGDAVDQLMHATGVSVPQRAVPERISR